MTNKKILVIDNEPRMVDSLKTLLTMEGYEVFGEDDPVQALSLLEENSFDLIISDIKMPEIDGLDILLKAREKDPFMGVILITGYASLETAKDAVDRGAFGYLTKPLALDELKIVVARSLEKRSAELERLRLLSELKSANEQLQMKLAQLDALTSAGNMLAVTTDRNEALGSILTLAIDVIGAKIGSVMIVDKQRNDLYIGASCGLEEEVMRDTRMKMGSSISGFVAETGRPLIIEDIEKDKRFARINRQKYESKSLISVPLKYKDTIFGVINLNNKTNGLPFTKDDLSLLNSLAAPAAVAIDRAELIEDKTRTINNLTILHNLAETVSMLDSPDKVGAATFDGLKKLLNLDSILWYDYHERIGELHLEFYHCRIPAKPIPEFLREIKLGQENMVIGKQADIALVEVTLQKLLSRFEDISINKMTANLLPIFLRRSLAGIAVLIFHPDTDFPPSQRELAMLALTQTAAIYQRQKAVYNATQLVTMGRLLADIGHDLKKPLTNLKGFLQIYKHKIRGPYTEEFFPEAEKEVNRLSELVKEMVEFSNPNKYHTRKLRLNLLLEKSLDLLKTDLAKKEIIVDRNFDSDLPQVMVNEHEMLQVFINILLNAVDSMDKGGSLFIGLEEFSENGKNWVRISIRDNGHGIPEENLSLIFARYYTTKETGTGLGLAIVERIISVHNGRISVESAVNEGTIFTIDMPV